MKVLLINASDINGGASRATYRLHNALLDEGVDSIMLVQSKFTDDYTVIGPANKIENEINRQRSRLDRLPTLLYKDRTRTIFSPAWFPFSKIVPKINEIKPDIVHLHWITDGMICIEDLTLIKYPIVWSLHDMWAFTGGCHYDENCGAYTDNCGNCVVLRSKKQNDLSRKVFLRKLKFYNRINDFTIVGLSRWINNCAHQSTLLKDKKIIQIPNSINTSVFKIIDKKNARNLWNFPLDKKLILFGAVSVLSDSRKGYEELKEALKYVKNESIELIVFGSSKPKDDNFGFKTHYLGNISDDISLVTLYNAVDIVVVPSKQENLSNVIMESLSCATPVVAFDIGGNKDMIEHKKNGYLAKPFISEDFASGIEWIISSIEYETICKNSREKVVKEFDSKIVVKKYIKLYKEILQ